VTYQVRLLVNARRDPDRIIVYDDEQAPEQTEQFIDEFYVVARRLAVFPYAGAIRQRDACRVSLQVFPCHLWYCANDQTRAVEIVAVLHHRQDLTGLDDRLHTSA